MEEVKSLQRCTLFNMMVNKKSRIEILIYCLCWQLCIWFTEILYAWKVSGRPKVGSHTFLGEKLEDFSRIFQDSTLIYMNLLPTKQNVCAKSYVLGVNMFTCRNARQGELENRRKPDIHCALVAQWTCAKVMKEQWEKNECFTHFVRISRILFSVYLNICSHSL